MSTLLQDLRYAIRQLLRSPGFTIVTVLTIALGIGTTTAIFSVVDGIVFRPLPFEEPNELIAVWSDWTRRDGPADEWSNFPDLWDLREQTGMLQGVGIWAAGGGTLTGLGSAEQIVGASVNHDMFARVLRAEPALGRGFSPEDDVPGAPATVLLSHSLWARVFGYDPAAVGQVVTLNGLPYTVIGVMPQEFRLPFFPDAEIWTPLRMDMSDYACARGNACMRSVARLAEGASLASARVEAAEISRRLEIEYPATNTGMAWNLQPLRADLVADTRLGLLVLFGAAGFVFLMACVNQASLLLARGTGRHAELALRSAVGAGRGRLVYQLMVESTVFAVLGGTVAIGAAYLLTDLLVALAPAGTPRVDEVAVNGRVLLFAVGATLLASLLFGAFPALRLARGALEGALRQGGQGDSRASGVRVRQALVAVQVALALVLLSGSGLLVRSFQNLREVELGFRPEGVLTFRVTLPSARYEPGPPLVAFHQLFEEALAGLPGVESAAATSSLPLAGFDSDMGFTIEGRPAPPPDQLQVTWYRSVTPGFLETIGIAVARGRGIEASDDAEAPRVVVINETFARRYFSGEDPIGQRLNFNGPANPVWWNVVGVTRDVKHFDVRGEEPTALYVPFAQLRARTMSYVVRSDRDPSSLMTEVRGSLASLDPELAAAQIALLTEEVGDALAAERSVTMLLGLFAVVAVALAVVGLYGTVSYEVNTRQREMGVRLALGARGGAIGVLVLRRSLVVVALGLAAGLAGSVGLTRLLGSLLFDVGAGDPTTLAFMTASLAAVAVLASLLPARRAARVDPMIALRAE